jgi:hypothetical protein
MDEEIPSEDEKPDIPKVEKNVLRKSRKKKEIFQVSEEEHEPPVREKPDESAEAYVTRRPRKKITQAQLDHLAGARVKALEACSSRCSESKVLDHGSSSSSFVRRRSRCSPAY